MNIYDVSKQAGVSIATVSRVLNNNPGVSEATREKVLKVMAQSGYQPNAFARGLGLNSMKTIGLLCADFADPFLAQAIAYLENRFRAEAYDCLLCCTGYELKDKERELALMLTRRVDALVFVGSNFVSSDERDNQYILDVAAKLPVMLLNGLISGENIYSTLCDDEQASFTATERLLASGCRDLLFLYPMQTYAFERKLSGFRRALAGRQSGRTLLTSPKNAPELLAKLWEGGARFDGVLASDDALAVTTLKFAKARGVRVPDELSIIGYNNSTLSRCTDPELSSIDNKLEALCSHLVSTLMGVLGGENMPKTTIYDAVLIERGTTRHEEEGVL